MQRWVDISLHWNTVHACHTSTARWEDKQSRSFTRYSKLHTEPQFIKHEHYTSFNAECQCWLLCYFNTCDKCHIEMRAPGHTVKLKLYTSNKSILWQRMLNLWKELAQESSNCASTCYNSRTNVDANTRKVYGHVKQVTLYYDSAYHQKKKRKKKQQITWTLRLDFKSLTNFRNHKNYWKSVQAAPIMEKFCKHGNYTLVVQDFPPHM